MSPGQMFAMSAQGQKRRFAGCPSLPLYGPLALIDSLAALILRFQVFLDEEAERPVE